MHARTIGFAIVLVLGLSACSTGRQVTAPPPRVPPLRVGVTPNAPPYAFVRGRDMVGLEVDFARALAQALDRPVRVISYEWGQLIPALQAGRVDVIMSGLSVTRERAAAIAFTAPYLRGGLLPVVRREDAAARRDQEFRCSGGVGVSGGTTAERVMRERCPREVMVYPDVPAAIEELKQRRIDAVVADGPIVIWLASQAESDLAPLLPPLTREDIAWGVRHDDEALKSALDGVVARWRTDGTRDRILSRWLPAWQLLEQHTARAADR